MFIINKKSKKFGGTMKGKIIKGIGGFYYVKTTDGLIECKARGKFRHRDMKPTCWRWCRNINR